ncbi:histone deacetylase [Spongiibacter marinus]|uniref:histone deacetylase n=1 Tax=Spongiibacter marinus TaxID=354246 RepID=UPI0035BE9852
MTERLLSPMKQLPLVTNPVYSYSFDQKHRFPMEKFGLLNQYLAAQHILSASNVYRPGKARPELLQLAHCSDYIKRFTNNTLDKQASRRLGLPWSEGLVTRSWISPNGSFLTAQLALRHGIACHLAGGTHHAHRDFGSGFCVFNDLAVAAKALLAQGRVKRLLIFDCDVHQGDGTATILADEPAAFTCSVHGAKNFPARKACSDLDVEVASNCEDDQYLSIVSDTLETALASARPELVIYDAGVDIYAGDPLGLLKVSENGIRQRDRMVIERCRSAGIPVATVIGGGYDDDRKALARRHAIVVEEAQRRFLQEQ